MFKRSGIWWVCIRQNGRKVQKSLHTTDRKLAKSIEAKIRTEIVEGKYYEKPIGDHKTFLQLVDKFMKEYAPKKSVSMQNSYAASIKHLVPFFGDLHVSSITRKHISRYKVLRRDEGAKPATINRELAMLSKAFTLAVDEWEWLTNKPFLKITREKENNEKGKYLTADEGKTLLENCPEWLKDLVVFALNTGLRQDRTTGISAC